MAKIEKAKPTKPKTEKKPATRKKYQSFAGLDCLNCTLPASVCCGTPRQCKAKFEKQLAQKKAAELKANSTRTRRKANV